MTDPTPQTKFEEFLKLCEDLLKGESIQFLALIKKRHAACSERFRNSPEMEALLQTTSSKLQNDRKRLFVHLKDFVTELKAWAVDGTNGHSRKRKAPDPLQAVAKAARVEESTSDSSDMEGKLQRAIGTITTSTSASLAAPLRPESENKGRGPSHSSALCPLTGVTSVASTSFSVALASGIRSDTENEITGSSSESYGSEFPLLLKAQSVPHTDTITQVSNYRQSALPGASSSSAQLSGGDNASAKEASPRTVRCSNSPELVEEVQELPVLPVLPTLANSSGAELGKASNGLTASVNAAHTPAEQSAESSVAKDTVPLHRDGDTVHKSDHKSAKLNSVVDKLKNRCSSGSPFTPLPSTSSALEIRNEPHSSDGDDIVDEVDVHNSDIRLIELDEEPDDDADDDAVEVSVPAGTTSKDKPSATVEKKNDAGLRTDKESEKQLKHVQYLENLLEKLRDKIEQVREKELTLDDLEAEDSSYIFEDRLQKKFMKVWNKLCNMKGRTTASGRPIERRFKYEGARYPEINRKIERFVNKRKLFPDFHDIKGIVRKVNTRSKLGLSAQQVNDISREAFLDVGEALQKRRHEDFIATFHSKQTMTFRSDRDPALFDDELRRKLDANRQLGKSRLEEVISKYTRLQYQTGENEREGRSDPSDQDGENENEGQSDPSDLEALEEEDFEGSIEMDLAEGWQPLEGEPLNHEYLEISSRTSSEARTHSSDHTSRGFNSNAMSRAGSMDGDGSGAAGSESDVLDIDIRERDSSRISATGTVQTGKRSRKVTAGARQFEIDAGLDSDQGSDVLDIDLRQRDPRMCDDARMTQAGQGNTDRLRETVGMGQLEIDASGDKCSGLVKENDDDDPKPSTSRGNALSFFSSRNSGSMSGSHSSPPRIRIASQKLSLKHPFKTKTNSKSPIQMATRSITLPSSLIKRVSDDRVKRGNLFQPSKSKPSGDVKVEDDDECMIIGSSDEDGDKLKFNVKTEDESDHSPSLLSEGLFGVNGKSVGTVKMEPFPGVANGGGDDDDVIVLSDSD